jgi:hypothetical protein
VHGGPENGRALAKSSLEKKVAVLAELDQATEQRVPRLRRRLHDGELQVRVGNRAGDGLLDALMHGAHPDRRAHRRVELGMQSHPGRKDRSDRLRVGDQRFVVEREPGLGAVPVGHGDRGQVPPVVDLGAPLQGEPCAVRRAGERSVELQHPWVDESQLGISGNLNQPLRGPRGIPEEPVDVEEREDEDVELGRNVLLRRVHLVDLQEVLDGYRRISVAPQLQVLDVHRLARREDSGADSEREWNFVASRFRFGSPDRQPGPVRHGNRLLLGQGAAGQQAKPKQAT